MRFYTVSPLIARETSQAVEVGDYFLPKVCTSLAVKKINYHMAHADSRGVNGSDIIRFYSNLYLENNEIRYLDTNTGNFCYGYEYNFQFGIG